MSASIHLCASSGRTTFELKITNCECYRIKGKTAYRVCHEGNTLCLHARQVFVFCGFMPISRCSLTRRRRYPYMELFWDIVVRSINSQLNSQYSRLTDYRFTIYNRVGTHAVAIVATFVYICLHWNNPSDYLWLSIEYSLTNYEERSVNLSFGAELSNGPDCFVWEQLETMEHFVWSWQL